MKIKSNKRFKKILFYYKLMCTINCMQTVCRVLFHTLIVDNIYLHRYKCLLQPLPDWVLIYFVKNTETQYKCNLCEAIVITDDKCSHLLDHITSKHNEIHELHKENPDASIGFQIEFLQLNDGKDSDTRDETVILTDVCSIKDLNEEKNMDKEDKVTTDMQYVIIPREKKLKGTKRRSFDFSRKRSWVWKYFDRLSSIIYRCNLCNSVLSIKGCNTNNMNRHVRSRHPNVYLTELQKKKESLEMEIPSDSEQVVIKSEEILVEKNVDESTENIRKHRRSWVWSYFIRLSDTLAQCKLCKRNICHGGNATGNMNRHLKMIHQKSGADTTWIWKVFDSDQKDYYSCKICNFKFMKFDDLEHSIHCIMDHLKVEHGVISSEQIITGMEYDIDEN